VQKTNNRLNDLMVVLRWPDKHKVNLATLQALRDRLTMSGDLNVEDVVDGMMLRAYHEFVKQPAELEVASWLIELAKKQIEREVKRLKAERNRTVHIEKRVPETPPAEEVVTLGEEILDFYEPDQALKLEDVFPEADVSSPEDFVAAEEELVKCINAALAAMSKEWSRALHLRHAGGLTLKDLGEVLEKNEPEVERILEYARQHLRQSLIESGCTFILKGSRRESSAGAKGRKTNG
jgi:RNA polymerase sigma factor (sigma-70 family)